MSSGRGCNHQMAILISSVMPCQALSRLHWPVVGVQQAVRESVLELGAARHAHVIAIAIIPHYHCRNPGVAIVRRYRYRNPAIVLLFPRSFRISFVRSAYRPLVPATRSSSLIVRRKAPVRKISRIVVRCLSEGRKLSDARKQWEPFVGIGTSVGRKAEQQVARRLWTVGVICLWRLSVFFVSMGARKRERKICEETRYVRRSL
jgi:hypothetical protein